MTSVIIVAAGSSTRMGFDKLTALIAGRSVLQRSVDSFGDSQEVTEMIVVTSASHFNALELDEISIPVRHIEGGDTRQESVAHGLATADSYSRYIAIHDGARPLITSEQISRTIGVALRSGAAASARRITDTVKRCCSEGIVSESIDRENLWIMETPQVFKRDLIFEAYNSLQGSDAIVTDEVSALERIGAKTNIVENHSLNPKITFPQDLDLAEKLVRNQ